MFRPIQSFFFQPGGRQPSNFAICGIQHPDGPIHLPAESAEKRLERNEFASLFSFSNEAVIVLVGFRSFFVLRISSWQERKMRGAAGVSRIHLRNRTSQRSRTAPPLAFTRGDGHFRELLIEDYQRRMRPKLILIASSTRSSVSSSTVPRRLISRTRSTARIWLSNATEVTARPVS